MWQNQAIALVLKTSVRKGMQVQILPSAPFKYLLFILSFMQQLEQLEKKTLRNEGEVIAAISVEKGSTVYRMNVGGMIAKYHVKVFNFYDDIFIEADDSQSISD